MCLSCKTWLPSTGTQGPCCALAVLFSHDSLRGRKRRVATARWIRRVGPQGPRCWNNGCRLSQRILKQQMPTAKVPERDVKGCQVDKPSFRRSSVSGLTLSLWDCFEIDSPMSGVRHQKFRASFRHSSGQVALELCYALHSFSRFGSRAVSWSRHMELLRGSSHRFRHTEGMICFFEFVWFCLMLFDVTLW